MAGSDHARRVVLACALTSILTVLTAAPASAQSSEAVDAARAAAAFGVEWLGPHPEPNPDLNAREPLWQGPGAMFVEQQVARRVIRSWWPGRLADATADAILDGFAVYLESRVVEGMFDRRYLRLAHSVAARPYFGEHVIWSFPALRLSRHALAARDRHAAVFDALEQWLGTPTLQGAMFQVARLPDARLTADAIVTTISNAAGQDLSWLFDAADDEISYAVTALTATSVTVTRKGAGIFTGRSAARLGDFQSGDAVRLKVVFGNGESRLVAWDGRDQSRTFQFEGPSPVTAAYLDPDRIVTLDRHRLDNAIVAPSPTNVPVGKWAARWIVWLQHTMLSYGFLA